MAIKNPCEEQDPGPEPSIGLPRCPPGKVRDENGRCVDENLYRSLPEVEVPSRPEPEAEDPFAESTATPPARPRSPNIQDSEIEPHVADVPYTSATRDLTTIDESSFYVFPRSITAALQERLINHSSIWLPQKTEQSVLAQADYFRLSLMNFWTFLTISEALISRPIGDPRQPGEINFGESSFLSRLIPLNRHGAPPYEVFDVEGIPGYSLMEDIPFKFQKEVVEKALSVFPSGTKWSHFMDIYMAGSDSVVWDTENRNQFWSANPDLREFYRSGNIQFDEQYTDYVFDAPAAFFESEMNNILVSPSDTADIRVTAMDQSLHEDIERETQIPNVYQYYQSKQTEQLINSDLILEENLPPGLVEYNQRLITNYEEFAEAENFDSSRVLKFPSDKVEKLEEVNEAIRGSLTNFVEINIGTANAGPLNALLQRNKMDVILLQMLQPDQERLSATTALTTRVLNSKKVSTTFTKVLDDDFIGVNPANSQRATVNDKVEQGISGIIYTDIDNIIALASTDQYRAVSWPRNLEEYPLYYTGWQNERRTMFEETIRSQIFLDRMRQHIKQGKLERTFADLLYGRKAYSEVVGYKIEKYRIETNASGQRTENKVQEFLLMDNDNIDKLNFLDTQVIPDKKYRYKIFTINLVIGTKYEYNSRPTTYDWGGPNNPTVADNEGQSNVIINVLSGKSISLIYAPFFEKVVSLADKPPLSPQVTFLPYQGIDYEHAILLQANYGEVVEHPVKIFSEDNPYINAILESQNHPEGNRVVYRSDSLPTEFEVIRIENAPESYRDFSQTGVYRTRKSATGKTAFFKLDIEPNKYYYYTFRTYDEAGMSNPTEVFRVRMVSYQNGIFMEMEPYEMYKKPKEFKISFEKVLKISPSMQQRMVNFEQVFEDIEADAPENPSAISRLRSELGLKTRVEKRKFQLTAPAKEKITLGNHPAESSVWDKKFKIRCTSKTTGKKIDYNVTFNKKKITLINEE
jgi:hypothetical protein